MLFDLPIIGIQWTDLINYPGHMCATMYLGGCNFSCNWCHNRSLLEYDASKIINPNDIVNGLSDRLGFIDSVCITGGEPLIQSVSELEKLTDILIDMGLRVKLDTNGFYNHALELVLFKEMFDYIAMDIKSSLINYPRTVHKNEDSLLEFHKIALSADLLIRSGTKYEFRTTVIPTLSKYDFQEIGKMIRGAEQYYIQQFDPSKCESELYRNMIPYSDFSLVEFGKVVEPYVMNVGYRGLADPNANPFKPKSRS